MKKINILGHRLFTQIQRSLTNFFLEYLNFTFSKNIVDWAPMDLISSKILDFKSLTNIHNFS